MSRMDPDEIEVARGRGGTFADGEQVPVGVVAGTTGGAGAEKDELGGVAEKVRTGQTGGGEGTVEVVGVA
jgi:hypothetical protein